MNDNDLFFFQLLLPDLIFGVGFVTKVLQLVAVARCCGFSWLLKKKMAIGIDDFIFFVFLI